MTLTTGNEVYVIPTRFVRQAFGEDMHKFKEDVSTALKEIEKGQIGAELVNAIKNATVEVTILKSFPKKRNACMQQDTSIDARKNACYAEVLSDKSLTETLASLKTKKIIDDGHPAIKKYEKFYGKKPASDGDIPQARNTVHTKYAKEHVIETQGDASLVNFLQRGLVGYHIMEHLQTGKGSKAYVAWDPEWDDVGLEIADAKRQPWMKRESWVGLAHELVHAWRMVTGRCVFYPALSEDYYEEAMTVGLPPYHFCRFTENSIRRENGLPLRTFYGESSYQQSMRAQKKHGTVEKRFA